MRKIIKHSIKFPRGTSNLGKYEFLKTGKALKKTSMFFVLFLGPGEAALAADLIVDRFPTVSRMFFR